MSFWRRTILAGSARWKPWNGLEQTLATLQKMERYRGHFLNWYDTRNLASLDPRYVSTVDSGNLAGNLLVVKAACEQLIAPGDAQRIVNGLTDALSMIGEDGGHPTRPG